MLVCFKVILADLEAHQSFIYIPRQGLMCPKVSQNDLEAHQRTATVRCHFFLPRSKWLGGGHNFTLATIAKIETILEESVISVRKYRKTVTGYNQSPEAKRRMFSDGDRHKYRKEQ